ncbi:MAG: hypothetical protein HYT93_00920 [Parcubacteria group bacterium]|nr:hypothetical protein [Parcubacteria group bacterium]
MALRAGSDDRETFGTYIYFQEIESNDTRDISHYEVRNTKERAFLGYISWFPRWNTYVFHPREQTIYEETCLREIAQFCVLVTKKHKKSLREQKRKST